MQGFNVDSILFGHTQYSLLDSTGVAMTTTKNNQTMSGGRGDSHMKMTGMVILLKGTNHGFWSWGVQDETAIFLGYIFKVSLILELHINRKQS